MTAYYGEDDERCGMTETEDYGIPGMERSVAAVVPAAGACSSCGGGASGHAPPTPSYVYAIGRIAPRFPNASLEREFAQVAGRGDSAGTDRQVLSSVLSKRENRYLARQLCWVFSIQGLETYSGRTIRAISRVLSPRSAPCQALPTSMWLWGSKGLLRRLISAMA